MFIDGLLFYLGDKSIQYRILCTPFMVENRKLPLAIRRYLKSLSEEEYDWLQSFLKHKNLVIYEDVGVSVPMQKKEIKTIKELLDCYEEKNRGCRG